MISGTSVVIVGHLVVGALFGLKELSNKSQWDSKVREHAVKADLSDSNERKFVKLIHNKPVILSVYSIVGYFNFAYVVKRNIKKLLK